MPCCWQPLALLECREMAVRGHHPQQRLATAPLSWLAAWDPSGGVACADVRSAWRHRGFVLRPPARPHSLCRRRPAAGTTTHESRRAPPHRRQRRRDQNQGRVRAVAPTPRGPQAQPTSGGILVRGQSRIQNPGDRRPAEVLMRYGAVDVYYPPSGGARAALLVATDPTFATVVDERVAWLAHVAPYEPGSFFRRELPATRAVVDGVQDLGLLVVDGYVDLDPDGRPGLGAHVHDE